MTTLSDRFEYLLNRLRTAYDGIGHSSGRPFVYFVYAPDQERAVRRLADQYLRDEPTLCFHHIDLLQLTIQALQGQEVRRQELLSDPTKASGAAASIMRRWAGELRQAMAACLAETSAGPRPVFVLSGLAALHPLGTPSVLMEHLAEREVRDPHTGYIAPIVILTPGLRVPGTSRRYLFLGLERLSLELYRGEEM